MNHEFWYLSRAAGFTAYALLFISVSLGIMVGTRLTGRFSRNAVFDIHRFTSILALAFTLFHVYVLLGDGYFKFSIWQLSLPFASPYQAWQTAAGVFSAYILVLVIASFYVRQFIGYRAWRGVHFLTFALFGLAMLHGIAAGTDTGSAWARTIYLVSGAIVLGLLAYRIQHNAPDSPRWRTMRAASGITAAVAALWLVFGAGLFSAGSADVGGRPSGSSSASSSAFPVFDAFGGDLTGAYSQDISAHSEGITIDGLTSGDLAFGVHIEFLRSITGGDGDGDTNGDTDNDGDEAGDARLVKVTKNAAELHDPSTSALLCDGELTALDQGYLELACDGSGPYAGIRISLGGRTQATRDGAIAGTVNGRMIRKG